MRTTSRLNRAASVATAVSLVVIDDLGPFEHLPRKCKPQHRMTNHGTASTTCSISGPATSTQDIFLRNARLPSGRQ